MMLIRKPFFLTWPDSALILTSCRRWRTRITFLYKNITVADGSATAGDGHNVLFKGSPLSLSGNGIKVGDQLRSVKLAQTDLSLDQHHRHQRQGEGPYYQRRAVARHQGVRTANPLSQREK